MAIAAKMPMMIMTTSSSTSVKPRSLGEFLDFCTDNLHLNAVRGTAQRPPPALLAGLAYAVSPATQAPLASPFSALYFQGLVSVPFCTATQK